MHQTTIRFASDMWARIEAQAQINGTSAAQFVREAALERLTHPSPAPTAKHVAGRDVDVEDAGVFQARAVRAGVARAGADEVREGSEAVWAQAQLARRRAREARDTARAIQDRAREGSVR
jgi:ribosomal protein S9